MTALLVAGSGKPESLAVIVPTFGRPALAARLLVRVAQQAEPEDEILVVDQSGDSDHAALLAALPPRVAALRLSPPGLPAARNAGIAATRAPIALFLDDDALPHPGCLDAHRRAFDDPTVGGVVGRIHELRLRPNRARTTNRISLGGRILTRLDGDRPAPIETLKGANMSVRRRALAEVGGFDEGYGGTALLEDADLSVRLARAGWALRYEPAAAVDHAHVEHGGVRQGSREATERWRFRNTAYFVRKHRGGAGLLPAALVFGAIAARLGWRERDPGLPGRLMAAFAAGARGTVR